MKLLDKINQKFSNLLTGKPTDVPTAIQPSYPAQQADAEKSAPTPEGRFDGPWPLDKTLIHFGTLDPKRRVAKVAMSHADSYMGIFVTGGNGSGKTSGTGKHLAHAYLKAGWGGLVLCAKPGEADDWIERAKAAGREDDLIVFGSEDTHGFNFVQYELQNGGKSPARAAVDVLMELVGSGSGGGDSKNKFWEDSARRLITACVDALFLAGERVTVSRLHDLSTSLDAAKEVMEKALRRSKAGELTAGQARDVDQRAKFLLNEWPSMAKETRSSILAHMTTALDPFLTGEPRDFFTETTTHTPDMILEGKIIVVGLSVKTHNEGGRSANIAWKYCLQRALERRGDPGDKGRPVFLFADEAQFFITERDADFVTTSRSTRSSMIYLTQNRPNLLSRLSKDRVDSILGCFQSKIWHQNGDPETNDWAANIISKTMQTKASTSTNYQTGEQAGQGSGGTSYSQSVEYQLLPVEFTRLATGGAGEWSYIVTAYLYIAGRIFPTTKSSYVMVAFKQKAIEI